MSVTHNKVFDSFLYTTATEYVDQNVMDFSMKSGGAIGVASVRNIGDYSHTAFWSQLQGMIRRRDTRDDSAVTAIDLSQEDAISVKVPSGTPPVNLPPSQFRHIQKDPEEGGIVVGEQLGPAMAQDQLNTAIRAVSGAALSNADMVFDGTASTMKQTALASGRALFKDRGLGVRSWVMHSTAFWDLHGDNLANMKELFQYETVGISVLADPLGTFYFVTDSEALVQVDGGGSGVDHYLTIGLMPNALVIMDNDDMDSVLVEGTGQANITRQLQVEYSYNVSVKGYAWNIADGGAAPTNTALATPANWTKVATSDKDTACVVVKTL